MERILHAGRVDEAIEVLKKTISMEPHYYYTYTLLGPPDADVPQGVINYLTPLGQALMGRKPGEHIEVVVEDEKRDLEVLAIENGLDS